MKQRTARLPLGLAAIAMASAVAALAGCDREPRTVGEKLDSAVSQAERKVESAKETIAEGTAEAQRNVKKAVQDTEQAMRDAGKAVGDAAITASVNAKLATDPELSALTIEVDTVAGRVAMHGSAPSAAAKTRATELASSVDGVRGVDNRLEVKPKG